MLDFFNKLFGRENSSATAKERLKLVLLSDHISLAPDVIERLKADLLEVISRYVEIDQSHADVTFEHREREIAMLANVPILGLRDGRSSGGGSGGSARDVVPAPVPAPPAVFRVQPDAFAATPVSAVTAPPISASHADADSGPIAPDPNIDHVSETQAHESRALATQPLELQADETQVPNAPDTDVSSPSTAHVEGVKPNQAPKRASNGSQRRRRRRKSNAPKQTPNAQGNIGGIGAMGRPAQA